MNIEDELRTLGERTAPVSLDEVRARATSRNNHKRPARAGTRGAWLAATAVVVGATIAVAGAALRDKDSASVSAPSSGEGTTSQQASTEHAEDTAPTTVPSEMPSSEASTTTATLPSPSTATTAQGEAGPASTDRLTEQFESNSSTTLAPAPPASDPIAVSDEEIFGARLAAPEGTVALVWDSAVLSKDSGNLSVRVRFEDSCIQGTPDPERMEVSVEEDGGRFRVTLFGAPGKRSDGPCLLMGNYSPPVSVKLPVSAEKTWVIYDGNGWAEPKVTASE